MRRAFQGPERRLCGLLRQRVAPRLPLLLYEFRLFGTSRGKRMFFVLVLPRQNAMRRKGFMSDLAKKREELFQVFLMR